MHVQAEGTSRRRQRQPWNWGARGQGRPVRRRRAPRATGGRMLAGLLATTAVVAVACGGSGASGTGGKTLTVQEQTATGTQIGCYIKLFKKQNPGITVTTTSVSQTAKTGSNLEVLTSASPPDLGMIPSNTQVYSQMVAAHDLVALNSVWAKGKLDAAYGANEAASLKSNGVPYVVSIDDTFYNVLYYDIPLFARLHITPPASHRLTSLSELAAIVKKLHGAGYQGIAIGGASGYQASWMLDSYLNTATTPAQYANLLASWQSSVPVKLSYTQSPFVTALQAIQTMGKDGDFESGYLGISQVPQDEALFVQGKAGMLLDGDYTVAVLKADGIKFSYGWMLLPPVPGSTEQNKLSLYTGDTYGIPVNAPDKPLAEKFLETVMSPQGQMCNLSTGSLPGVNTMPGSDYASLGPIVQQELADAKANGAQIGWTSGVPGGLGQQFTDPLVQSMLNGQLTPQQIAAKVQAELATFRAKKG